MGTKRDFNVSEAFSVGELCESHTAILLCTIKRYDFMVTVITLYASSECGLGNVIHYLREDLFAGIHNICLLACW